MSTYLALAKTASRHQTCASAGQEVLSAVCMVFFHHPRHAAVSLSYAT